MRSAGAILALRVLSHCCASYASDNESWFPWFVPCAAACASLGLIIPMLQRSSSASHGTVGNDPGHWQRHYSHRRHTAMLAFQHRFAQCQLNPVRASCKCPGAGSCDDRFADAAVRRLVARGEVITETR